MKSILSILKADRICARADKDHDKFATLTLVIGEYDVAKALKKNLTRDENDVVIDVIQAYVTKVSASIEEFKKLGLAKDVARAERDLILLDNYLPEPPVQFTVEELEEMAEEFNAEGKKFGDFMNFLRTEHKGEFDGAVAAQIAKRILPTK